MNPPSQPLTVLAIESSCDETACSVVQKSDSEPLAHVLSSVTATSLAKHKATKGIVPEIAAREQLKYILPVIEEALSKLKTQNSKFKIGSQKTSNNQYPTTNTQLDAIAVTVGPGLAGSLLVGIETARALAMAWNLPIIPVNHIKAHPYANFIKSQSSTNDKLVRAVVNERSTTQQLNSSTTVPNFPLLSWVISGGHTDLFLMNSHTDIQRLGGTVDDAAGECFDKCARVLGFDYPGGPFIEKLAGGKRKIPNGQAHPPRFALQDDKNHHFGESRDLSTVVVSTTQQPNNTTTIPLPRPLFYEKTLNMSFSGLKAAFLRSFNENKETIPLEELQHKLATALQEAVTDIIVKRTQQALELYPQVRSIIVSGGVSANQKLREKLDTHTQQPNNTTTQQLTMHFPSIDYCTDNAAMIGSYALFHMDEKTDWKNVKLDLS